MDQLSLFGHNLQAILWTSIGLQSGGLAFVAQCFTTCYPAARSFGSQSASRCMGDARPLLFADDALEGESQIINLARHNGMKSDIKRCQPLPDKCQMFLVTAQAVDVLNDQDACFACFEKSQRLL
nr:hypothetical protein [Novosphingobium umbonatum]